jgi:TatD DNase family protein
MMNALVDAHCHIGKYPDRDGTVKRARAAGIRPIVATSRPSEFRDLIELFGTNADLDIGLGFHPECAGSVYVPTEIEIFNQYVGRARWISEIGLDGLIADSTSSHFGNIPTLDEQVALFRAVLDRAGCGKVYSIHSRGAESLTIDILNEFSIDRVVLHSFSGTLGEARRAVERGFYFSIHPAMVSTSEGRSIVNWLPVDRMLIETDGPYFAWHDRPIEPSDYREIVAEVSRTRRTDSRDLLDQLGRNYLTLTGVATGSAPVTQVPDDFEG